jgi:nucleotide-binding universal stress UspA family protein
MFSNRETALAILAAQGPEAMKMILVASDLSARSDWAVERALALAKQHDARARVVHVVDEELPASVADEQKETAERILRSFVASLLKGDPAQADVSVVFGAHYSTIIDMAEKENADLVVVGKHRQDALLDLFRGSTGERVLRFGARPVLVVKDRATIPYLRALVAVDFSPCSRKAWLFALELVPDAQFELMHAFDIPFRGLLFGTRPLAELAKKHQRQFEDVVNQQVTEFVTNMPRAVRPFRTIARDGAPQEAILSAIAETEPQLVVLGTHGRSGLARAWLGSVAEYVIANSPKDVLAVRGW